MMKKDDGLLTIAEFAKALSISEWTARKWLRDGRVRGLKIGGGKEWRIPKDEIAYARGSKYLESRGMGLMANDLQKGFRKILKISEYGQTEIAWDIFMLINVYDTVLYRLCVDMENLLKKHKISPPPTLKEAKMMRLEGIRHCEQVQQALLPKISEIWALNAGFKSAEDLFDHILHNSDDKKS